MALRCSFYSAAGSPSSQPLPNIMDELGHTISILLLQVPKWAWMVIFIAIAFRIYDGSSSTKD